MASLIPVPMMEVEPDDSPTGGEDKEKDKVSATDSLDEISDDDIITERDRDRAAEKKDQDQGENPEDENSNKSAADAEAEDKDHLDLDEEEEDGEIDMQNFVSVGMGEEEEEDQKSEDEEENISVMCSLGDGDGEVEKKTDEDEEAEEDALLNDNDDENVDEEREPKTTSINKEKDDKNPAEEDEVILLSDEDKADDDHDHASRKTGVGNKKLETAAADDPEVVMIHSPGDGDGDGEKASTKVRTNSGSNSCSGDGDGDGDKDKKYAEEEDSENPLCIAEDEDEDEKKKSDEDEDEEEDNDRPMIRMKSDIFEAQNEDEEEEGDEDGEGMDPMDIQSMMQVEMEEEESSSSSSYRTTETLKKQRKTLEDKFSEEPAPRRTPRRAAAQAAANTIKQITNMEEQDVTQIDSDPAYRAPPQQAVPRRYSASTSSTSSSTSGSGFQTTKENERYRCHQCKNIGPSLIVVRQYGTDIHLCSNSCFNAFRNPDPVFRPLPCAKCGILNRDTENAKLYFWETMNFCSDLCVGNYQLQIGAHCSTCQKKTPWACMGKYCVRFGSDVRQFCTATCLENYKKTARVCFHCQLDIKRLGNVVLANIPSKGTTKEFCSQDCVEMYIEQNIRAGNKRPTTFANCFACRQHKVVHKELVTAIAAYKACSEGCWSRILDAQKITTPTKCETCTKYINMDTITISPSFYIATEKKAHGFCSATCKNVYVLKSRAIMSCTNCKVKKYNYDLIQYVTGRVTNYAVCSLNCLPKPSQYILNLKDTLNPATTASQIMTTLRKAAQANIEVVTLPDSSSTVPTIKSVIGNADQMSKSNGAANRHNDNKTAVVNGDHGSFDVEDYGGDLTVRQASDDDIIEIRDDDDLLEHVNNQIQMQMQTQTPAQAETGTEAVGDEENVSLDDERWLDCDIITIIRPPSPVQRRNVMCQARPIRITKQVQTDSEELWAMPRIEMKLPEPEEKIRYVPVPIPYPVLIPFPFYGLARPVPIPFPLGIPVPIPIPVDMSLLPKNGSASSSGTIPGLAIESEKSSVTSPIADTDDVEMMDTSESTDAGAQYLNVFNFTNSPMSVGSPSVPTGSSLSGLAPGSPQISFGGKGKTSRAEQGVRAWKLFYPDEKDPFTFPPEEFASKLVDFVLRATKLKGDRYEPDVFLYFVLGIQQQLKNSGRTDSFFYDSAYSRFVEALSEYAEQEASKGRSIARVEEEHIWECMELGACSPGILLFTLIYLVYKYFHLKTWQEFAALDFSQIQIKENISGGQTVKFVSISGVTSIEGEPIEVPERTDNPLRCPVKLFEFYMSKCETPEGAFYKAIEPQLSPGSHWYTTQSLNQLDLYRMLVRAMMIKFEPAD